MSESGQTTGGNAPRYQSTEVEDVEVLRYRQPSRFWISMMFLLTVVALALAVNQIFRLNFFKITTGNVLVSQQYMYLTLGTMVSMVFILMPPFKGANMYKVLFYDLLLFIGTLVMMAYFTYFGLQINMESWEYSFNAPGHSPYVALAF